jgi:hypothetical protein
MSEMPGPLVAVIARAPAQLAPSTMPMAAISSSACTTPKVARPVCGSRRCFSSSPMSDSTSDDDGVIGYQLTTVTPPNIAPSAAAVLPSISSLFAVSVRRSTR